MRRQTEFIWGAIGIALVSWWLARTLGVVPLGIDDFILRALPSVLILAGLTLLLRNRLPVGNLIALILTIALVGGVGYVAYSSRATQERIDYQQALDQAIGNDITLLRVRVNTLTTEVELLGLPSSSTNSSAVTGQFIGSSGNTIVTDFTVLGDGSATLILREERAGGDFPLLESVGRGQLTLELPSIVPLDVEFVAQDGDALLNLGNVQLERLNVTAQLGDIVVTMPNYDPAYSQADALLGAITSEAGNVTVLVPAEVGATFELNRGNSGIQPDFPATYNYLVGDILESRNITSATKFIRYTLTAPRGRIQVSSQP